VLYKKVIYACIVCYRSVVYLIILCYTSVFYDNMIVLYRIRVWGMV